MTDHRDGFVSTAIQRIPTTNDLHRAPRHRQEQKVKASIIGIVVLIFGLAVMAFAGYVLVAVKPTPDKYVLGGIVVVGFVMFAFGALWTDRETALPALTTLVTLGKRVQKATR